MCICFYKRERKSKGKKDKKIIWGLEDNDLLLFFNIVIRDV